MANVTPILGTNDSVDFVVRSGELAPKQVALGTKTTNADGHELIWAQATGAIPASTAVVLTEPAMTVAAGAGAWSSRAFTVTAYAAGDRAWFRKNAI